MAFDIEAYTRRASRLCWDDLDFGAFEPNPLDHQVLRCLRYMHDVEFHTACYLRDLLVTPAHSDPEVTAFLSMWVYEEYWHGEALAGVLAAHGERHGQSRIADLRSRLGLRDRMRPIALALGGCWQGSNIVALEMTWGVLNEAVTQTGYQLLARRADHPVLSELLRRIVRQEALHLAFYTSQARSRLDGDIEAQRFVRRWLRRLWRPVGSRLMPKEETAFLHSFLLGDLEGGRCAARIDRRVDSLPGMSGLRLLRRSMASLPISRDACSAELLAT
jgi:hypothetical protein